MVDTDALPQKHETLPSTSKPKWVLQFLAVLSMFRKTCNVNAGVRENAIVLENSIMMRIYANACVR